MSSEERLADLKSTGMIEMPTFEQILEMDDEEEERDFSKSIVYDFFDQAEATFEKMDAALQERNLLELSSLGHFLKGSSATLGLIKVRDSCEKIQNFGAKKDETGNKDEPDDNVSLSRLKTEISATESAYHEVETELRKFYGE